MHTVSDAPPIGDAPRGDPSAAFPGARPRPRSGEWSGPSRGASVLVEVGPGTGALVVYVPAHLDGEEIEIRRHGGAWTGSHTAVRARHLGPRVLHAGVFGSLPVGLYDLRRRPSSAVPAPAGGVTTVAVGDGTVVETSLAVGDRPA